MTPVIHSISVKTLDEQHLSAIVDIHQSVLGYTLNSQLGKAHLASMYSYMARSPGCCVLVAFDGETPIGLISGAVDFDQVRLGLLREFTPQKWATILLAMVKNPLLIGEWIKSSVVGKPVFFSKDIVNAILTTIAIKIDWQRRRIGKLLIGSLEEYFLSQRVKVYRLDTLVSNDEARSFYKKIGFQEVERRADSVVLIKRIINQ